jgi:NADH:ubiquinone oxidoreductase subunit 4 (subunit M)
LANFAGEIMIFFGAFKHGWTMDGFHIFQIATVLALWGVVISTVYMLRAYRKTFMGTLSEQWKQLVDLRPTLRVPVTMLVGALICCGFFPQTFVRMVAPTFRAYLTTNTSHLTDMQTCSDGAARHAEASRRRVRHPPAVGLNDRNAPPASLLLRHGRKGRGYSEVAWR